MFVTVVPLALTAVPAYSVARVAMRTAEAEKLKAAPSLFWPSSLLARSLPPAAAAGCFACPEKPFRIFGLHGPEESKICNRAIGQLGSPSLLYPYLLCRKDHLDTAHPGQQ
ncbi:hypothetical protein AXG93_3217s1180 [Marchantia polymorpha subsp. ruderalis]|uniref:Secreted protein n=1 Tax=Marchantia polymorpha subsp. ruderalis TaxID=1480154 RepID=A0A176VXU8_MARPO|nr:hypothetical protein AXG93_3217s1180 [Marchantia polymorpha subsp. ruderalis]